MRELYHDDDMQVLILPAQTTADDFRLAAIGRTINLMDSRADAGLSPFFAEMFFPVEGEKPIVQGRVPFSTGTEGEDPQGEISWNFTLSRMPDEQDLIFAAVLAGCVPCAMQMVDKNLWEGGNYLLSIETSFLRDLGFDEEDLERELSFFSEGRLHFSCTGSEEDWDEELCVLEQAGRKGTRLELEINPLALTRLMGMASCVLMDEMIALFEQECQPGQGHYTLLCALVDALVSADDEETVEELSLTEIAGLLGRWNKRYGQKIASLLQDLGRLPEWKVEHFEEIAEDGKAPFRKGESVWRISHTVVLN